MQLVCPPLATAEPITVLIMLLSASVLALNLLPLVTRGATGWRGGRGIPIVVLISLAFGGHLGLAKPAFEAALLTWHGVPTTGVITAHRIDSSPRTVDRYQVTVDYTVPTGPPPCVYVRNHLGVPYAVYAAFPPGTTLVVWYLPAAPGVIALDSALHTWARSLGILIGVHGVAIGAGIVGRRWPRTTRRGR